MTILGIIQARVSSSRLPGKVLKPILGKPMLALQIERLQASRRVEKWVLATSTDPSDDPLAEWADRSGVSVARGSLNDVLDRFYQAAALESPQHVVRATGDCPLFDPDLLDLGIDAYLSSGCDYLSNGIRPTFPDGLDFEVMRFGALEAAWKQATLQSEREHVTPFIYKHPEKFRIQSYENPSENLSRLRWTVDEPVDFEFVSQVYQALYPKMGAKFRTRDVLNWLENEGQSSTDLNSGIERNEGYKKSLQEDKK